YVEHIRVLLVELGERADGVGAQELALVEHLRKDPAEPLRVDQSQHPPFRHAEMTRSRGVDGLPQFGYPAQAILYRSHRQRNTLPLPLFDNSCGAQGEETHHGANLEPRSAAIRE